jgi:hypothetical protein
MLAHVSQHFRGMTTMASVAEVRRAGVTIEAEEAVAIAQQLITALRNGDHADVVGPPYGPPTLANVYLGANGSVTCRACETTPAVSEIAIFVQAMLPPEAVRVPGGLRYTIARALLDVDVPPFDSLDDFSETLARYERGPRDQIVRRVVQRLDMRRTLAPVSAADRRRHPQATELRRALREADARLYLHKVSTDAANVASPPARPRRLHAGAACVAAGLMLIIAGEFVDGWHRRVPVTPLLATPAAGMASRDVALRADEPRTTNDERRITNDERRTAKAERRTANDERRSSPSLKRASRVAHAQPPRVPPKQRASPGVLDRLRLHWLRNVFTSL